MLAYQQQINTILLTKYLQVVVIAQIDIEQRDFATTPIRQVIEQPRKQRFKEARAQAMGLTGIKEGA
ncbi:hypothetical protein D3C80_1806240 [compost metagenome]